MTSSFRRILTASSVLPALCVLPEGHAQDSAELAKAALNPIAAMYSLPLQYNWD